MCGTSPRGICYVNCTEPYSARRRLIVNIHTMFSVLRPGIRAVELSSRYCVCVDALDARSIFAKGISEPQRTPIRPVAKFTPGSQYNCPCKVLRDQEQACTHNNVCRAGMSSLPTRDLLPAEATDCLVGVVIHYLTDPLTISISKYKYRHAGSACSSSCPATKHRANPSLATSTALTSRTLPLAMDAFFTLASPIATEQPEVPTDEETVSSNTNRASCVIA